MSHTFLNNLGSFVFCLQSYETRHHGMPSVLQRGKPYVEEGLNAHGVLGRLLAWELVSTVQMALRVADRPCWRIMHWALETE